MMDVSVCNNVHNLSPKNSKCRHIFVGEAGPQRDKPGHLKHKALSQAPFLPVLIRLRTTLEIPGIISLRCLRKPQCTD